MQFEDKASNILEKSFDECKWMWTTHHTEGGKQFDAIINFVAWSDVLVCPHCSNEIVFGKTAATKDGKIKGKFNCPHCHAELKKGECEKEKIIKYNSKTGETYSVAKQVPLLINYSFNGNKYEKEPDDFDLKLIEKIDSIEIPYWYPDDKLPEGYNTEQPIRSHGYDKVNLFYTNRILYFLAKLYDSIQKSELKDSLTIWFTSQLINIMGL